MLWRPIFKAKFKSEIMKLVIYRVFILVHLIPLGASWGEDAIHKARAIENRMESVEWVGHRGASFDAPENTVASAKLAWDRGADGVEVDVYLSNDQEVVVIHDKTTKRTTSKDLEVSKTDLADLMSLDAGGWKNNKWKGINIPSLTQILKAAPENSSSYLVIEIKSGPEIIPALQRTIAKSCFPHSRIRFISFNWNVIQKIKTVFPDVEALWLSGFKKDDQGIYQPSAEKLIKRAQEAGADGVDVSHVGVVNESFVKKIHEAGLKLWVYTVNEPKRAKDLVGFGVDSITTDRPAWLKKQAEQNGN